MLESQAVLPDSSPGQGFPASSTTSICYLGMQAVAHHQPASQGPAAPCTVAHPPVVEAPKELSDSITSESAHVDVMPGKSAMAPAEQAQPGGVVGQGHSDNPLQHLAAPEPDGLSPNGHHPAAAESTEPAAYHVAHGLAGSHVGQANSLDAGHASPTGQEAHALPPRSMPVQPGSLLHDHSPAPPDNQADHVMEPQQAPGSQDTPADQAELASHSPALALGAAGVVQDTDMTDQHTGNPGDAGSEDSDEEWGKYLEVQEDGDTDKGCQVCLPMPADYPRLTPKRQRKRPADWELDPMHMLALAAAEQPLETGSLEALAGSQWGVEEESTGVLVGGGSGMPGRVTSYASLSSMDLPPARVSRAGNLGRNGSELDVAGCTVGQLVLVQSGEDEFLQTTTQHNGKRPRLAWTPELHAKFVQVVDMLGPSTAVPKTILHMMGVKGLTREQVASHLQKYRLSLKLKGGGSGGGAAAGADGSLWGASGSRGTPPRAGTPPRGYMRGSRQDVGMDRSGSGDKTRPDIPRGNVSSYAAGPVQTSYRQATASKALANGAAIPDVAGDSSQALGGPAITLLPTAQVSRPVGAAAWLAANPGPVQLPLPALARSSADQEQQPGGEGPAAVVSTAAPGAEGQVQNGGRAGMHVMLPRMTVTTTPQMPSAAPPAQLKVEATDVGATGHMHMTPAGADVAPGSGGLLGQERQDAGALVKRLSQNSGVAAGAGSKALQQSGAGGVGDGTEGTSGENKPGLPGLNKAQPDPTQQQSLESLQSWAGKQGYRIVVCMPGSNEMGVVQQHGMQPVYATAPQVFPGGAAGMQMMRLPMQQAQGVKGPGAAFQPAPMLTMTAPTQGVQWMSGQDGDVMQAAQQQTMMGTMQAMPQMTMINGRPTYVMQQALPQAMQLIPGTGMARMINPMMPMQMGLMQQGAAVNMMQPMQLQQDSSKQS